MNTGVPFTQTFPRLTRRGFVNAGSLAVPGLSLPSLLQADQVADIASRRSFGQAKSIIFLYLAGGPPQHETFDPKPEAPREIRGPFSPISTNIPGIQFCELLPRTAVLADKLAVVRSMATDDNIHSSSGAWVLTGHKYRGTNARVISDTDWPYFGSLIKKLRPAQELPALSTVWLPDLMRLNENVTPAGQTAGFMGAQWNPEVFVGDPSAAPYEIESLRETDITRQRMRHRHDLLTQLDSDFPAANRTIDVYDSIQQQAFQLLTSGRARRAFHIDEEPAAVRDRYGRNRWGQCVLLARRLVEAGVRLVHVQWPREPGDSAADNPLWDTHAQNADRLEDVLCPMFDVGFSALIEDLDQRGLLSETLVVAVGEFGRTPRINAKGGRDHWGSVFSCVMAGAGISGGQVYGSSDRDGAYPVSNRVEPGNLTASMFHLVGLDYQSTFPDRLGRELGLTNAEPIWQVLGDAPATPARMESNGSPLRVPPFAPHKHLVQTGFAEGIRPVTSPSRPKGWRAEPLLDSDAADSFGVSVEDCRSDAADRFVAVIGIHSAGKATLIDGATRALLAQEVRSPFSGTYLLTARLRPRSSDAQFWHEVFLKHTRCRLQFLLFKDQQKNVLEATVAAESPFLAELAPGDRNAWQTVELQHSFINPNPGGNFSFGSGLAVAVRIDGVASHHLSADLMQRQFAVIQLASLELKFQGKQVNDKVTV